MANANVLVRLTTPVTSERQYWRAGEKYECSEREAKVRLERGEAVPCDPSEADFIPPDGTVANIVVNRTVREQTAAVQPSGRARQRVGA